MHRGPGRDPRSHSWGLVPSSLGATVTGVATPHHSAPPPPDRAAEQRILNESWPPDNGARGARDQPAIAVTARVEWEHDGIEEITTTATRWTHTHVMVHINDSRKARPPLLWLRASDVRRR